MTQAINEVAKPGQPTYNGWYKTEEGDPLVDGRYITRSRFGDRTGPVTRVERFHRIGGGWDFEDGHDYWRPLPGEPTADGDT